MLDVASPWSFLVLQFVDDTFTFVSNTAALRTVNTALSSFCTAWRHRFQGGRKRPTVMAVGGGVPEAVLRGSVCGEVPRIANYVQCLGILIHADLSLHMLFERVCARLLPAGE